jgi:hypothetical protein
LDGEGNGCVTAESDFAGMADGMNYTLKDAERRRGEVVERAVVVCRSAGPEAL